MDQWAAQYLEDWRADFGDEPDAEQCLRFQSDVLEALKILLSVAESETETSSHHHHHHQVASSIAAAIEAQKDNNPEGRSLQQCLQAVLFEAATTSSSPLDPGDLANVILLFMQQQQSKSNNTGLAQKFRHDLASNVRERWNGPDIPSDEDERDKRIQEWINLNALAAHLTRLNACSLEGYALRTFDRAFPQNTSTIQGHHVELDYHVPAAAAWMRILGREIYLWSSSTESAASASASASDGSSEKALFDRDKWNICTALSAVGD